MPPLGEKSKLEQAVWLNCYSTGIVLGTNSFSFFY
uniref:Uncharacterized protein n=1 Tax=Arundo donax TaxID=35708 RepID=A0A0A8YFM8_ARUDO